VQAFKTEEHGAIVKTLITHRMVCFIFAIKPHQKWSQPGLHDLAHRRHPVFNRGETQRFQAAIRW
jgi:hypothetical protein